jgi:restriction system protein
MSQPEKSLFAVLLRSPWWISFAVAGVITLASGALLPKES